MQMRVKDDIPTGQGTDVLSHMKKSGRGAAGPLLATLSLQPCLPPHSFFSDFHTPLFL